MRRARRWEEEEEGGKFVLPEVSCPAVDDDGSAYTTEEGDGLLDLFVGV